MPMRSLAWPITLAFALVAAAFLAAVIVSQRSAASIHVTVHEITDDAAPAIEHLAAMRAEILQAQLGLSRALAAAESSAQGELSGVRRALAQVEAEVQAYRGLRLSATESEVWSIVSRDIAEAVDTLRRAQVALEEHDRDRARRIMDQEAPTAIRHTTGGTLAIIRHAANVTGTAAARVEETRLRAVGIAAGLSALALVLTAILGTWLVRTAIRFGQLQAAHQRMQQERLRELELFGARIAHDLRSPITAALVSISSARRHQAEPEVIDRALERARATVQRLSEIVDGLYEFARVAHNSLPGQHTSVREAVTQTVDEALPLAEAANVTLRVGEVPAALVAVSPGVVASVLSNLVRNAIKYSGAGAVVSIQVDLRERLVRFEVTDTGPGIPAAQQETLFEPFVRGTASQGEGLGLGLATVKRLTSAFGGACGVQSVEGQGSLFWFELPLAAA